MTKNKQTITKSDVLKKAAVPLGLAVLIFLLGISLALPKSRFQQAKERLTRNPQDFEAHLILAEEFLNQNQIEQAEKELLLAQETEWQSGRVAEWQSGNVLGINTSKLEQLWQRKKKADPQNHHWLIKQWEKIIAQKPDYRDGYLRLALLHYQLHQNQQAQEYLKKAFELDPNFEPVKAMEKIILNN